MGNIPPLMRPRFLPDGQFQPGNVYRRRDLHIAWGGQQRGGISTPSGASFAFLFTGEAGEKYGYRDEWLDAETYGYCGEGQEGDQELVRGNRSIADRSPDIHLFQATKDGFVQYVHQMFYADHFFKPGVDKNGKPRELVVFKLRKYQPDHLEEALAAKRRALRVSS